MADRLHVFIEGVVQGVGFRYLTCRKASILELKGWVRNTPDGKVEAEFEGSREALERMLIWCQKGPDFSRVDEVTVQWSSGDPLYENFMIH